MKPEIFNTIKKISNLKSFRDKNILELGCYTGNLFPLFQKQGAFIEGIDIDNNAISKAQKLGRLVHYGDIDDPDGAIGPIKGSLSENPEYYDLIFSHDVWTPSAVSMSKTIKNLIEVPVIYLKPKGYLIHMADITKGLHKYDGLLEKKGILENLGTIKSLNKEVAAWRKK